MQLKKLAVLCNACFWLTLFFQLWEQARGIHQVILNNIVVLGILAVLVNLTWIIVSIGKRKKSLQNRSGRVKEEINKEAGQGMFNAFNLFSFIAQVILLGIKLL